MKQTLLVFFAVLLCVTACEQPPTSITGQSPEYTGTMAVFYEGENFVQSGIAVKAEVDPDESTIDIMLRKVKFVPAMPVRLDVTLMDVPVEETADGGYVFSADGVIPWAMGGPYDTFRADGLTGVINGDEISFTLDFYHTKKNVSYPTEYQGSK